MSIVIVVLFRRCAYLSGDFRFTVLSYLPGTVLACMFLSQAGFLVVVAIRWCYIFYRIFSSHFYNVNYLFSSAKLLRSFCHVSLLNDSIFI
jgi:hypothetical protein